jgi:hypothetical protein
MSPETEVVKLTAAAKAELLDLEVADPTTAAGFHKAAYATTPLAIAQARSHRRR